MDILSITNKSSVSSDAKVYAKDENDFVTTTFDALYNKSSAKTNIEKSVSDANARIDTTNNTVAELDNYARAKGNGIVLQSQGEMVTVNDSSDDYMVNLKPYGKSEQDSTTGAQLVNLPDGEGTHEGIKWTCKNGVVTASGTATAISTTTYAFGGNYSVPIVAGEYYISGTANNVHFYVLIEREDGTNDYYENTSFFLYGTEARCIAYCQVMTGRTVNETIYPMLNAGETALPYEPYTNGASPNPDYPQEIRSTVISEIKNVGKNWLKNTATSQTIRGVNFTVNSDKSIHAVGTATENLGYVLDSDFSNNEEVIVSGCSGGSANTYRLQYYNPEIVNADCYDSERTVPANRRGEVRIYIAKGTTINTTFYPMIRKADIEDATYEPYTETVATLSEPITLYGIPTNSDGNFTDSNGQQWIADYIDVAKGKVVRCVNTEVFDGSSDESWYLTNGDVNFFNTIISKKALSNTKILCNIAPSGVVATYTKELGCLIVDSNILRYRYEVNNDLTVDDVRELLSQHNMIIYYPLATPTEEDLPTADVVALKNLKTFYSVTNVTNDSEVKGEMVLLYNADTKMYIDNKFAELAAQLV